ncbi:hypothetical protein [Geotalea uraniireducens]|uniref:Carboxypeptidase regulatory-like domain-containing protein n=1 Tax=Geotalea uraniireducens (strain Rf4) TaxID=351605 RepID=A5G5W9_GEOUR|nr:hypothetical protein [Geotalea uraniireducens]ABQ27187.1 hypothetical protein Gura_3015 [Geotalea uraniireducens Rf4]
MKAKLISLSFAISMMALISGCLWAFTIPDAKITLRVVDETGEPVKNVKIEMGFQVPRKGEQGIDSESIKGETDAKGLFTASGRTIRDIGYEANKEGYYESYGEYKFKVIEGNRWQPWDQIINVVLRKIENPVPMYARDSKMSKKMQIPDLADVKSGVGFDLMEYDWVAPYGKGIHSDLIFKLNNKYFKFLPNYVIDYEYDSELTITFSNRYDGIQLIKDSRRFGSKFKLPRYAPEDGYNKSMSATRKVSLKEPVKQSFKDDNNYIFRIRSEEKDGKLIRAMYGKIQGEIEFNPKGLNTAVIIFRYYLNPDYTRNLEYDPKRNLFKNLEKIEYVGLE